MKGHREQKERSWAEECEYLARLLERGHDEPRVGPKQVRPYVALQALSAHADGFVLVPEASEGYPQGAAVTVYLRR